MRARRESNGSVVWVQKIPEAGDKVILLLPAREQVKRIMVIL